MSAVRCIRKLIYILSPFLLIQQKAVISAPLSNESQIDYALPGRDNYPRGLCSESSCQTALCEEVDIRNCRGTLQNGGFCDCCKICVPPSGGAGDPCTLGCLDELICDGESAVCIPLEKFRRIYNAIGIPDANVSE